MKIPRKSQYPQKIKVNKVLYTIVFVDQIEGKDTLGLCDFELKVIFIKNKQKPTETFKTFIHEFLHAIEFEFNCGLEHSLIYKFEESIAKALYDNIKEGIFKSQ